MDREQHTSSDKNILSSIAAPALEQDTAEEARREEPSNNNLEVGKRLVLGNSILKIILPNAEEEEESDDSDLWMSDFQEGPLDERMDAINEKVWFKTLLIDTLCEKHNIQLD